MGLKVTILCWFLCGIVRKVAAQNGNNYAIFTAQHVRESFDASHIFDEMSLDTKDVIYSVTNDPTKVEMFVVPTEWNDVPYENLLILKDIGAPQNIPIQQPKVLIQLNDVIHKLGDYLKYRILLTDDLNKPLSRAKTPFRLSIALVHETLNTVVSQDVKLYPGDIYSGEHLFTDDRDNGEWNITVKIGEHTTTKQFLVKPYAAPIHQITIDTEDLITQQDFEVAIHIDAMYTFGKPILGILNITVSIDDRDRAIKRTASIAGHTVVTIPMEELINAQRISGTRTMHVDATVTTTNGITQRLYNATRSIPVYASPYKLVAESVVDFYPGENATLFVKVMKSNGKPLDGRKPQRDFVYVYVKTVDEEGFWEENYQYFEQLTENYTAIFSFPTHEDAFNSTVIVLYNDIFSFITVKSSYEPQLYVSVTPSNPSGDGFELQIVASKPMDGVLAIIRKHNGENVPLYINCNQLYYHLHYVPGVRLQDVKRVNAISRFDGNLVQATTPLTEPALSEKVHLSYNNGNITVFTKGDASYAGVAVYEGWFDEAELDTIYTRATFNPTIYPEIREVFPQDAEHFKISSLPESHNSNDQVDLHLKNASKLFNSLLSCEDGEISNQQASFRFTPPSHINQMVVTAFVFSPTGGLGMAKPILWQRQQCVQIYLHIPHSAKKMEPVTVDVYIVNSQDQKMNLKGVNLINRANDFTVLENVGGTDATRKPTYGQILPYEVQRTEFLISPKRLGSITLRAYAFIENEGFALAETTLHSTPVSVRRTGYFKLPINLVNSSEEIQNLMLNIPRTVVAGTEKIVYRIKCSLSDNALLSATMLEGKLVQADPFTVALRSSLTHKVLTVSRIEWLERRTQASRMIRAAISKIQAYANPDGSFTIPDQHTPSSPCWDTAIAVQALTTTHEHLQRWEQSNMHSTIWKALRWLRSKQVGDGYFCTDDGDQSATERVEQTAHVLLAFLHTEDARWDRWVINNASNYLLSSISTLHDPYHLALVGHVLKLSLQHAARNEDRLAISETVNLIWDSLLERRQENKSNSTMWWNSATSTPDLVATSYALMLMTSMGKLSDAVPVVNWIKGQPYRPTSNFTITPNSHIALRALIEFAMQTIFVKRQYTAVISSKSVDLGTKTSFFYEYTGEMVDALYYNTRNVSGSIRGTITGSFEIRYSYMESVTTQNEKFEIDLKRYSTSNQDYTDWSVCIRFTPKGTEDVIRGKVMCEITFPTGYMALDDSVDELNRVEDLVATKLMNYETLLEVTFEEIGVEPKCFNVTGFRRDVETHPLPGTIKVYDVTDMTNIGFIHFDTKTQLKD